MLTWLRGERRWTLELSDAVDLTRRLSFDERDPAAFGLPRAHAAAVRGDGWTLRTTAGGSVNCDSVTLTPHGNTTHTETVGHIALERPAVADLPLPPMLAAVLLRVAPEALGASGEGYAGRSGPGDPVVTAAGLETAWSALSDDARAGWREALIIGAGSALDRPAPATTPPYLTTEAVAWIRALEFDHVVLDVPSIDRLDDGGGLPNHHAFWGLPQRARDGGARSVQAAAGSDRSITELALVPPSQAAGPGALMLAPARWALDAAPARLTFVPARLLG